IFPFPSWQKIHVGPFSANRIQHSRRPDTNTANRRSGAAQNLSQHLRDFLQANCIPALRFRRSFYTPHHSPVTIHGADGNLRSADVHCSDQLVAPAPAAPPSSPASSSTT